MVKGQMLRPTKGFPTEVTPENLDQTPGTPMASIASPPPQRLPEPAAAAAVLPAADAPPAEIEKAADAIIAEANLQLQTAEAHAAVAWVSSVSPALRLVWETDSHRQATDPSTGKPYRSIRKWAADRKISKSQFYRLINEVPVREALGDIHIGQMGAREAEFGARLLRANDAEAVRKVWLHAIQLGGAKLKNLETAAKALKFQLSNAKDSDEVEPEVSGKAKAVLSLATPAKRGWNEEEVLAAAASDLSATREAIAEIDRFRSVLLAALGDAD